VLEDVTGRQYAHWQAGKQLTHPGQEKIQPVNGAKIVPVQPTGWADRVCGVLEDVACHQYVHWRAEKQLTPPGQGKIQPVNGAKIVPVQPTRWAEPD
jgi:hypothetical protein